jgi:hypothetical protein
MLKNALHQAGFGQVASKLQENIKQGLDGFTIPVSYHVNEKERMDFGLSFAKDQNGQYRFEGYRAALTGENKPQESRQQVFHIQEGGVTATEAYHLLSGRALQPQSCVGENKWLQLDFTDKDATGNHRVKEFRSGYGYDLEQTLRDLPLKENQNPELAGKLAAALAGGDRQQVTVERNGREQKFFIEANPQGKTVTLYDEHSRKVSLSSVLGRKPADTVRQAKESLKAEQHAKTEQHTGKARKNGMSIG